MPCLFKQFFLETFWASRKWKDFTGTVLLNYLHNILITQIGATLHTLTFTQQLTLYYHKTL